MNLYEIRWWAIEEFQESICESMLTDGAIWDLINDVIDRWIPIYTVELLDLAKDDLRLACSSPKRSIPSDNTPLSLLTANIYEYLNDELWKRYNEEWR